MEMIKSKSLFRSLLKGTVLNLGLQLANRNLNKNNFWQTLLVGAVGGFGDYFGGNTAMGAIIGGGNALINKTKDFSTAIKYAAIGGAADLLLKVKEAKALKPYQDEPIPITDEFLAKAQKVWFKDFPMEYVKKMTVENVTEKIRNKLDLFQAPATTCAITSDGAYTGYSVVYFNSNLAFTSPKMLYYAMGHELVHVSQNIHLKSDSYMDNISDFATLKEYFAYSFQKFFLGDSENIKLNSFTSEIVRRCMTEFNEYVEKLNYQNLSWIQSANFIYPF